MCPFRYVKFYPHMYQDVAEQSPDSDFISFISVITGNIGNDQRIWEITFKQYNGDSLYFYNNKKTNLNDTMVTVYIFITIRKLYSSVCTKQ